jgi:hypothetical protein
MVVSQRRRSGGGLPSVGEKRAERGKLRSVPHVGVKTPAACQIGSPLRMLGSPVPGHWLVALGRVLKPGMSPNHYGSDYSSVRPANNWFSIFPNWTKFINYENHLSVALKITQFCNMIKWKIGNNFPFANWTKFINYENHFSVALKITQYYNMIKWKIGNNFPFANKFKL